MSVEELRIGLGVLVNGSIFGVVCGFRKVGSGAMVDIASPKRGSFSTSLINVTPVYEELEGGEGTC